MIFSRFIEKNKYFLKKTIEIAMDLCYDIVEFKAKNGCYCAQKAKKRITGLALY